MSDQHEPDKYLSNAERRRWSTEEPDEDCGCDAARGILIGAVLSLVIWAALVLVFWPR